VLTLAALPFASVSPPITVGIPLDVVRWLVVYFFIYFYHADIGRSLPLPLGYGKCSTSRHPISPRAALVATEKLNRERKFTILISNMIAGLWIMHCDIQAVSPGSYWLFLPHLVTIGYICLTWFLLTISVSPSSYWLYLSHLVPLGNICLTCFLLTISILAGSYWLYLSHLVPINYICLTWFLLAISVSPGSY
jgi:hypothetical protein